MAKIEEMSKSEVRDMLVMMAGNILEERRLDSNYPYVFCGVRRDNEIHIWKEKTLLDMAEIMDAVIHRVERDCEQYPYQLYFVIELFGKNWKIYSLSQQEDKA